jgi:hypothetical protein
MRKSLIALAAVAAMGFGVSAVVADHHETKKNEMTGVLIDKHCGEEMAGKDDAQAKAEAHKKGCALKCSKDDNGTLYLMSEGKMLKLDEKSSKEAAEYLGAKEHNTKVMVEATKNEDGSLAVAKIKPAKDKDKEHKEGEHKEAEKH